MPGRDPALQPDRARGVDDLHLGRRPGPFPPPGTYTGGYCARNTAAGVHRSTHVDGLNGNPLTTNGNANNHQHWTQVYCGHEIQINESLTGGDPGSRSARPDQDRLGLRLPQPQRASSRGPTSASTKGVWHEFEIRTIGQQYTILVDGEMINQFDNSIPKIASRAGDPPTMARQLARGYLGLQTHGGNDRISYREIQVKEFAPSRHPGQHGRAVGTSTARRHRLHGQAADVQPRHVERARGRDALHALVSLEQDPGDQPALPRAEPARLLERHDAVRCRSYGNQALTWLDSQVIGTE